MSEDEDSEDTEELDVLKNVVEEAKYTTEKQTKGIVDRANRTFQLLRLNLLLFGAILAAVPAASNLGFDTEVLINIYSVTGMIMLYVSIVFCATTYWKTGYNAGISALGLKGEIEIQSKKREYYQDVARSYTNAIRNNDETDKQQLFHFNSSLIAFISSIIFFGVSLPIIYYNPKIRAGIYYLIYVLAWLIIAVLSIKYFERGVYYLTKKLGRG